MAGVIFVIAFAVSRRQLIKRTFVVNVRTPYRSLAADHICCRHPVVAASVNPNSAACRRVCIIIVVPVEAVPPVKMILRKVGMSVFTGDKPVASNEEIAFHSRHSPVGPAGTTFLVLNRGNVTIVPEVIGIA